VNGKILPPDPKFPLPAQLRHQQVAAAIVGIETQIAQGKQGGTGWKQRAAGNLGWLKSEEQQLREWLVSNKIEILPPRPARTDAPSAKEEPQPAERLYQFEERDKGSEAEFEAFWQT
jgi:hypothetical protein